MNEPDLEQFESELQKLKPTRAHKEFLVRLANARPTSRTNLAPRFRSIWGSYEWWRLVRWLVPAMAGTAVLVLLFRDWSGPGKHDEVHRASANTKRALNVDDVEIDQQLVAVFDAVARLPSGEPVRFRCREWTDEVVLRDSARGIVIEQSIPRLEIVPVRMETY